MAEIQKKIDPAILYAIIAGCVISFISFEIELDFLYLPLAGIVLNFFVFLLSPSILKISRINKASRKGKTLTMLLSSFAPGISCFPIIEEFLGSEYLIRASLIDFGNKLKSQFHLLHLQDFEIFGPAVAPISRIKNKNRVRLLIKSNKMTKISHIEVRDWLRSISVPNNIYFSVDIDPYNFY